MATSTSVSTTASITCSIACRELVYALLAAGGGIRCIIITHHWTLLIIRDVNSDHINSGAMSTSSSRGCSTELLEELLLPPLSKAHNRAVMVTFFLARLMSLAKSLDIKLRVFIFLAIITLVESSDARPKIEIREGQLDYLPNASHKRNASPLARSPPIEGISKEERFSPSSDSLDLLMSFAIATIAGDA
jgi:hypothetical protein